MLNNYYFKNLIKKGNLQSLVMSENDMRMLKFAYPEFAIFTTSDKNEILARQEIFMDITKNDKILSVFKDGVGKIADLHSLAIKIGNLNDEANEAIFYSLMELLVFTDCVDTFYSECDEKILSSLKSSRLKAFFEVIKDIENDGQFVMLKTWLGDLNTKLRNIKSLTVGVNLDSQLNVKEIGIVSINEIPFVNKSIFDKAFRKEDVPNEYTCITTVGMRESKSLIDKKNVVIDYNFYNAMNSVVKNNIKSLKKYITTELLAVINGLCEMYDEIEFIITFAEYILELKSKRFPLTFPEVTGRTNLKKLYNPMLMDKYNIKNIIPSDVIINESKKIFVLTGPNSGGKTVYITSLGIAQIMFQLGLPVTAEAGKMQIFGSILTHFVQETKKATESRLENEAIRLREELERTTNDTLLLMDEVFSSTSAYDALFLAEALIQYLKKIGCTAFYVTHLHELVSIINDKKDKYHDVIPLSAVIEDGRRTYRIEESYLSENNSSFARDVVVENGLGFLFE